MRASVWAAARITLAVEPQWHWSIKSTWQEEQRWDKQWTVFGARDSWTVSKVVACKQYGKTSSMIWKRVFLIWYVAASATTAAANGEAVIRWHPASSGFLSPSFFSLSWPCLAFLQKRFPSRSRFSGWSEQAVSDRTAMPEKHRCWNLQK